MAWGLRDPVVEGSTVRVPGTNRLLFSHPDAGIGGSSWGSGARANLSLFSSEEGGAPGSWTRLAVVQRGPSACKMTIADTSRVSCARPCVEKYPHSDSAVAVDPRATSEALVLFEAGSDLPAPCQGSHPCWQSLARIKLNTTV